MSDDKSIIQVDYNEEKRSKYKKHLADCIVITADKKILLQKRLKGWSNEGGYNLFGGHVEKNENIQKACVRELNEELGLVINKNELTYLVSLTEAETNYTECVHIFFYHDKKDAITGCYECEPTFFETIDDVVLNDKVMMYTKWALKYYAEEINKILDC